MEKGEFKKILVVEDDQPLARLLQLQLERDGFQVHVETSGKPAVTYAGEHALDLVILDLKLQDISGYEVCKELRRMSQPWELPILMLTAMCEPVDQLRGYAYGADAFLPKPCDPTEFRKTVSLLLGETVPGSSVFPKEPMS